jgi:hypothetical protein
MALAAFVSPVPLGVDFSGRLEKKTAVSTQMGILIMEGPSQMPSPQLTESLTVEFHLSKKRERWSATQPRFSRFGRSLRDWPTLWSSF